MNTGQLQTAKQELTLYYINVYEGFFIHKRKKQNQSGWRFGEIKQILVNIFRQFWGCINILEIVLEPLTNKAMMGIIR